MGWITFFDGSQGYCEADTDAGLDAMQTAERETGKPAAREASLPYPARPIIWQKSDCPPFCHQPNKCAGRGSCPRDYACSD